MEFSFLDMTPYDLDGWLWLITSYNEKYPAIPLVSILLSFLFVVLLFGKPPAPRLVLTLLAFGWAWCGAIFQMQFHASLNWAAIGIGWVFIIEASLLVIVALFAERLAWCDLKSRQCFGGTALIAIALLYPLIGRVEGRTWSQLEWVFFTPTPTTIATLGIVLVISGTLRWIVLPLPLLWSLISAAFTLKLDLIEPYLVLVVLSVFLYVALASGRAES